MASDTPWAEAILRRSRRNGIRAIVGGLVAFIVVGTAANVIVGDSDELRNSGGQTSGVVVATEGVTLQHDTGALVDYTVDGHRYEEEVDLGNQRPEYEPGQQVTVYYDLSDPSTMTINDINNEPTWTVLPMAIGFVGGVTFMIGGVIVLVSTRRKRNLLAHSAWREDATVLGIQGTAVYCSLPDVPLLKGGPLGRPGAPPDAPVRVAGASDRFLLAVGETPTALLRARPPRSEQQEQLWRREIDRAATAAGTASTVG
jgi:hypothetical protein